MSREQIAAEVAAASAATTPEQREKHERAAIAAWLRIAIESGLGAMLRRRVEAEMREIDGESLDLDAPAFTPRAAWQGLAHFLNDMKIGILATKAGLAIVGAALDRAAGRDGLLSEPTGRQGVDRAGDREHTLKIAVVSLAAHFEATTGCSTRDALAYATGEYAGIAAAIGLNLSPEALRREINDPGGGARRKVESELAAHYRRLLRLYRDPENRAAAAELRRERQISP